MFDDKFSEMVNKYPDASFLYGLISNYSYLTGIVRDAKNKEQEAISILDLEAALGLVLGYIAQLGGTNLAKYVYDSTRLKYDEVQERITSIDTETEALDEDLEEDAEEDFIPTYDDPRLKGEGWNAFLKSIGALN